MGNRYVYLTKSQVNDLEVKLKCSNERYIILKTFIKSIDNYMNNKLKQKREKYLQGLSYPRRLLVTFYKKNLLLHDLFTLEDYIDYTYTFRRSEHSFFEFMDLPKIIKYYTDVLDEQIGDKLFITIDAVVRCLREYESRYRTRITNLNPATLVDIKSEVIYDIDHIDNINNTYDLLFDSRIDMDWVTSIINNNILEERM